MSETPDPGDDHSVPASYRLATAIPGAKGLETGSLDSLVSDTFEHGQQTVGLVFNYSGEGASKTIGSGDEAIALPIYAGCVFAVIDGCPTVTLTPTGGEWFFDPFDGRAPFGPDHPVGECERYLLDALHFRLRELGEELPPIEELLATDDGGES